MKKTLYILFVLSLFVSTNLLAQLNITVSSVANTLAQTIAGTGVTVTNASLSCGAQAAGTFTYTGTHLGMPDGIILTTGHAVDAEQPETYFCDVSNGHNVTDADLHTITTSPQNDMCSLSFDFVPLCSILSITYVFGSEEYPDFAPSNYNDAFGIFLTGPNPSGGNYTNVNIGTLPSGTPVSINNVNAGTNSTYFVPNYSSSYHYNDIAYGGFTIPITSTKSVTPCQSYHMEIAIADIEDEAYDSGVFIEGNAVSCTTAPDASIASTPVACGGSNGTASVTVTNYTATPQYHWSTGDSTSSLSGLSAGTYTCLVTLATGCSNITQTLVTTVSAPASNFSVTASATPANCPTSANGSATVTISGGTQPYNVVWGTTPVQTTTVISSLNSGVYNVTVSDANSCVQTASVTVGVTNIPNTTSTNTTVCGNTLVLTSNSGTNYQWYDNTGALITGATSQNYSATTLGNGQSWGVSYVNPSTTCRDTMIINITAEYIQFSNLSSPPCGGTNNGSSNFNATGSYTLATYNWSLTGASSNSASNVPAPIAISGLAGGTYSMVITQPGNPSCAYTTTFSIASGIIPPPVIDTVKVCNMDVLQLNPSIASGSTNNWYVGTSTVTLGSTTTLSVTPNPVQVDGTIYTDTIVSSGGCKTVLKYEITVQSFIAQGSIIKKPKCHNDSLGEIKLSVPRETNGPINQPYTFTWEYPAPETSPAPVTPGNTPPSSTEYSLHAGSTYTCVVTAGNCAYTYTYSFVNPAALALDSLHGYYCPKDSLALLVADTGSTVNNYQWYSNENVVGGANTYSLQVVTQDIDNYHVAYLRSGCVDSAKTIITVTTYNAFVPKEIVNVFSPNGDTRNDVFYPFYQDNMTQYQIYKQAQNYDLKIYNRWGILVYESTDYNSPWNGKIKGTGTEADSGTYFYITKYQSNCGAETTEKKGFVELVR